MSLLRLCAYIQTTQSSKRNRIANIYRKAPPNKIGVMGVGGTRNGVTDRIGFFVYILE
jgi:hypothetical protein